MLIVIIRNTFKFRFDDLKMEAYYIYFLNFLKSYLIHKHWHIYYVPTIMSDIDDFKMKITVFAIKELIILQVR